MTYATSRTLFMSSAQTPGDGTAAPAPNTPTGEPLMIGLRVLLFAVAFLEMADGASDLPALFSTTPPDFGTGLGAFLVKAKIATHLPLAIVALIAAPLGYIRTAVIALAALIVMTWLADMPSVVLKGLDLRGPFSTTETLARIVAFPLMAACALAYAARGEYLGRAALLVSIPTLFKVILVVGFTVSVVRHGF